MINSDHFLSDQNLSSDPLDDHSDDHNTCFKYKT